MGKVEKEGENLKEMVSKDEERVQEVVMREANAWKKKDQEDKTSLKEVMEEQFKERKEEMAKQMIGVLRQKEQLVREIAEKKSVIIFGMKENKVKHKPKREREELKSVKDSLKNLNHEER